MSNPEVADHKQLEPLLLKMKNRRIFQADAAEMLLTLDFFTKRREGPGVSYVASQFGADQAAEDGLWTKFCVDYNIRQEVSDHLEEVRRSDDLLREPRM